MSYDPIEVLKLLNDESVTGGMARLAVVDEPLRYSVEMHGAVKAGPFECRWHPDDVARWSEQGTTHYMDADKRKCAHDLLVYLLQLAAFGHPYQD